MPASPPVSGGSTPSRRILSAVGDEHRRAVLQLMDHAEREIELHELTDRVASEVRQEEPSEQFRQRIAIALHHIHLPQLDDCGLLVYDTETKQVHNTTHDSEQELQTVLELSETLE